MPPQDTDPRLTLRDRQRALTYEALVEATIETSVEHGFAALTVDQIVRQAGVSRPTFYLHFASKAHVAHEVSRRLDLQVVELYDGLPSRRGSRADIVGWLNDALAYWADNRKAIAAVQQAVAVDAELNLEVEHRIARYASSLAALIDPEHGSSERRQVVATTLILQLERVGYFWKVRGWTLSHDTVEVLADQWSRYLL